MPIWSHPNKEGTAMSKKLQEEPFSLGKENFPTVLRQYGLEGAKIQALSMCEAQKIEPTLTNMYSALENLENDLSMMFSHSGFDIDEEAEKKKRTCARYGKELVYHPEFERRSVYDTPQGPLYKIKRIPNA
jgi:hypothetical protein